MEIARHWRLKDQRLRLLGEKCGSCESTIFPPRDVCPNCGGPAHKVVELSGKGTVEASTTIYQAPAGYEKYVPYQVAHVKLDEGPRVTAQLTDLEDPTKDVKEGTKVELVTRVMRDEDDGGRGVIVYGWKAREPVTS